MVSIISAIIVLGVLIFVHELGHFLFAKLFGVGVEKFSLGFGTKVVGFKRGETEYLISAFPLGGYVKMVGEGGDVELSEEEKARSFAAKPPLQRIAIVAAGPVFNLLFAWIAFIAVFMIGVPSVTTKIGEVVKDKPAAQAGIKAEDVVTAINGRSVDRWDEFAKEIAEGAGKPVSVQVKRGDAVHSFTMTPETRTAKNLFGENVTTPVIGVVAAGDVVIDRFGPVDALLKGSVQSWNVVKLTVLSLVKLVERTVPLDTVGGPIMIAKMAGQQAAAGGASFIAFMALLSVNLGILNLLPVPILDGGHLFFFFIELVTGRPVSQKTREVAQQVGLVLLVGLMLLAFYNDIARYFVGQG
ncbi:RIP metalloprotease RseP [Geobacter sp. DSM 9736]|uniref:RIP metalloprotease RseP n=1 Tax=Geobacter sp. DSM 9736 TaxID=1277350 RepID=UPI000B50C9BB|nr:RIP metalloprotease RseP [Geobacter sp. DSM 9736]SNB46389.1 regulator of sigma E protease [Geobacter sp. DSM 9736]